MLISAHVTLYLEPWSHCLASSALAVSPAGSGGHASSLLSRDGCVEFPKFDSFRGSSSGFILPPISRWKRKVAKVPSTIQDFWADFNINDAHGDHEDGPGGMCCCLGYVWPQGQPAPMVTFWLLRLSIFKHFRLSELKSPLNAIEKAMAWSWRE